MSKHEKFAYPSMNELKAKVSELNNPIEFADDLSVLSAQVKVGRRTAPNAFAILPMEGCDSNTDGSPSPLVERRYMRFAEGGAGLLWWEACAVEEAGKANPLQMMLTNENIRQFKALVKKTNQGAIEANGYRPLNILQLTHSGRYARPEGHKPIPMILYHDPLLDPRVGIDETYPIVTDEYLDSLPAKYLMSAKLAKEAGFDGVDIKACHRYLISELLASHTRSGKYGGALENRTRLLLDIIRLIRKELGEEFIIASRFNVYDAHPYPYGFGVHKSGMWTFDPEEPLLLVKMMIRAGADLLSNSAGNPYYIYPQVTRPFDTSSKGIPTPDEHPLDSVARLFDFTAKIQEAAGKVPVVGNGYTWLRHFLPYAGASNLAKGKCRFVGLGRMAFAYPDAPRDVLRYGGMKPEKCCITCSKCTQIMRDHGRTGCVIKDRDIYGPLYKEAMKDAKQRDESNK